MCDECDECDECAEGKAGVDKEGKNKRKHKETEVWRMTLILIREEGLMTMIKGRRASEERKKERHIDLYKDLLEESISLCGGVLVVCIYVCLLLFACEVWSVLVLCVPTRWVDVLQQQSAKVCCRRKGGRGGEESVGDDDDQCVCLYLDVCDYGQSWHAEGDTKIKDLAEQTNMHACSSCCSKSTKQEPRVRVSGEKDRARTQQPPPKNCGTFLFDHPGCLLCMWQGKKGQRVCVL